MAGFDVHQVRPLLCRFTHPMLRAFSSSSSDDTDNVFTVLLHEEVITAMNFQTTTDGCDGCLRCGRKVRATSPLYSVRLSHLRSPELYLMSPLGTAWFARLRLRAASK